MRRAARVDDNQAQIVRVLRAVGATVQSIAGVGDGCPDLLVGFRRQSFLLEVKDAAKVPSAQKLTKLEERWHLLWQGLPVSVVHTPEEALEAIGITPTCHNETSRRGDDRKSARLLHDRSHRDG